MKELRTMKNILTLIVLVLSLQSYSQEKFILHGSINNQSDGGTFIYIDSYDEDKQGWELIIATTQFHSYQFQLRSYTDYRLLFINGDIVRDLYVGVEGEGSYFLDMESKVSDCGLIYYDERDSLYYGATGTEEEVFGPDE